MTDFDPTWKNPTEAQLAAWERAAETLVIPKKERGHARGRHSLTMIMEAHRRAMAVDAGIHSGLAHQITPYALVEHSHTQLEVTLVDENVVSITLHQLQGSNWREFALSDGREGPCDLHFAVHELLDAIGQTEEEAKGHGETE